MNDNTNPTFSTNPTFAGGDVVAARAFTRHLTDLLRKEQGALVSFLLALAECDGRRLWADLGYASLFDYLHRELKLSKSSAWYRAAGAALIVRYPAISDALGDGRLCVSTLGEIRKVITPENAAEILPRFFHCSAREAKEIAAAIAPAIAPPRQDLITKLRAAPRTIPTRAEPASISVVQTPERRALPMVQTSEPSPIVTPETRADDCAPPVRHTSAPAALRVVAPLPPQEEVRPLTADLRRLHVTVTKRWVEKLEAARAVLSHSIPSGSAEAVLEAALDALLERDAKRKGLLTKPRRPRSTSSSAAMTANATAGGSAPVSDDALSERPDTLATNPAPTSSKRRRGTIPAHVRRGVLLRDGQRCQALLHDGTICGSTVRLQFDHVVPDALGGPATVENGRILCGLHNQLAARTVFGEAVMDLFATSRR